MRIPRATYRLQFGPSFGFRDAAALVPYLDALGISDLYASPLLVSRKGSEHGYDITDPYRLNPALGSEADFRQLAAELGRHGMGLLLDIVPNHMAASPDNHWWMDVLENGSSSPYASFFDIDWQAQGSVARPGMVLLPVLGAPLVDVLARGEMTVGLDAEGFSFRYYEHRFPLSLPSYAAVFKLRGAGSPRGRRGEGARNELRRLVAELHDLHRRERGTSEGARLRRRKALKRRLWRLFREGAVRRLVEEKLRLLDLRADRGAVERLQRLLALQHYRLAYWRTGLSEVNYRRFFDVSDLVGVRVEEPRVFERRHARVLELVRKGAVTGLRVDHVDGLFDPLRYLERLQGRARSAAGRGGAPFYVVVEKVLSGAERLREGWPVAGTTGYEFAQATGRLFLHADGWKRLRRMYRGATRGYASFAQARLSCKRQVLADLFAADFLLLARELLRLAADDRRARRVPAEALSRALFEVCVALPVYRTYVRAVPAAAADRAPIERALALAGRRLRPDRGAARALSFLRRVLLLEDRHAKPAQIRARLAFVMRWQQRTGAVMAKGLEDTAFYVDNALLSLNEVGGDPEGATRRTTVAAFHAWNRLRQRRWPQGLSATASHDTKRGEDARLRLHLLSEDPQAWEEAVTRWREWNDAHRLLLRVTPVPDPNEEWLIYQALLGAWPLDSRDEKGFAERFKGYVRKAAREAKVHTSWLRPDEAHEAGLLAFVDTLLDPSPDNRFLPDFRHFHRRLAFAASMHSLGQVILKAMAPGVPDFYQGTELWDLSLVDPDNRRPVDFAARRRMLAAFRKAEARNPASLLHRLLARWPDGRLKLYVTWKALALRRARPELFAHGAYVPLLVDGPRREHVVAFARQYEGDWAVVVLGRWLLTLGAGEEPPLPARMWRDTAVQLPTGAPSRWRDWLTGRALAVPRGGPPRLDLHRLLAPVPVALMSPESIRSMSDGEERP